MSTDPIVDAVVERIHKRSADGMRKFGKPMTRDDKTTMQWIDDAIEEALDLAVYLTRVKVDMERENSSSLGDDEETQEYRVAYDEGYEDGVDSCDDRWQDGYDAGYIEGNSEEKTQ